MRSVEFGVRIAEANFTMPAIAAAASSSTMRLMRLMPAISTTELSIRMSLSPTHGRTWPEASVLTISFGTPIGRARMAAVPMVVPAEPPRASTPSTLPASKPRDDLRARRLPRYRRGRGRCRPGISPATRRLRAKTHSRSHVADERRLTEAAGVDDDNRQTQSRSRSRTKAASGPLVSSVARR